METHKTKPTQQVLGKLVANYSEKLLVFMLD